MGDHFGYARYRDLELLASSPEQMNKHLKQLGAKTLIINRLREPFNKLLIPQPDPYLQLIYTSKEVLAYKVL
jgi:hypothetical protein